MISIHLLADDQQAPNPPLPGQFVTVGSNPTPPPPHCCGATRCRGPADADEYRISVKREAHGAASGYLHTALQVGDTLEIAAPRGAFVLRPGDQPVVLVSAGVGATPVLAMLYALAQQGSRQQVWWLHGARSRAAQLAAEVDAVLARLPDVRLVCYSHPGPGDRAGVDFDVRGHLTAQVLDDAAVPTDGTFYLCGPTPFMARRRCALTHGVSHRIGSTGRSSDQATRSRPGSSTPSHDRHTHPRDRRAQGQRSGSVAAT